MSKRGYTCRAPLMSTEGLSPTIYSVLNWWLLISWLATWTLSWRDDTICLRTSSAFLNTNEFGFPKVVYSNGWGWILHIQTGGFSMVHKSHETNHHLYHFPSHMQSITMKLPSSILLGCMLYLILNLILIGSFHITSFHISLDWPPDFFTFINHTVAYVKSNHRPKWF